MKHIKSPFIYTRSEDIANSISHGIGALLILSFGSVMISKTGPSIFNIIAVSFYIFGVFMMLLMSTLYHALRIERVRSIFQKLDHSMVYLAIFSTYAPILLLRIQTKEAYILFVLLGILTIIGMILKGLYGDRFIRLSTGVYIAMGWAIIFLMDDVAMILPTTCILLLVVGGISYTFGALLFLLKRIPYNHFIWHLFVLAGVSFHFAAIYFFVI